jgi:hypothetical protein
MVMMCENAYLDRRVFVVYIVSIFPIECEGKIAYVFAKVHVFVEEHTEKSLSHHVQIVSIQRRCYRQYIAQSRIKHGEQT